MLLVSLFMAALSVGLVIRANIGNSPVSGMVYVLNLAFPHITVGTFTILFNVALIIGQLLMLRKNFEPIRWLQFPISFIVGAFTDLTVWLTGFIPVPNYFARVLVLILGCLVSACSVSTSVQADVAMNSGEAFVTALRDTFHKEYGTLKIGFDIFLLAVVATLSLTLLGHVEGIREGTIINAVLVGSIVKIILPKLGWLERWMRTGRFKE